MSPSKETSRLEAFSDGVFAIVITLLVLDLVETLHDQAAGESLLHLFTGHWESFLAFTIGFITILVCWINHHFAFEPLRRVDYNMMWINGFLLFIVTLTPFSTAILARYLQTESHLALAIYGANYVMISVAAYAICRYAYNKNLVEEEKRPAYRFYPRIYGYAIVYNLVALALCFVWVVVPIAMYVLLFIVFAAPKKFASRRLSRGQLK